MKRFLSNAVIGFARACLPLSFLIAFLIAPGTFIRGWREVPGEFRRMWDDPL